MQLLPYYRSKLLSLCVSFSRDRTDLTIQLHSPIVTTRYYPQTVGLLDEHVPTIFQGKCFNYNSVPFRTEAEDTEIPHLFEHILLEFLFLDDSTETYTGKTYWNWDTDPSGLFRISINHGVSKEKSILTALDKSLQLLEQICRQTGDRPTALLSTGQPVRTTRR